MTARIEIAPAIFLKRPDNLEDLGLVDYSDQIAVLTNIARAAFDNKTIMSCLLFGMAGTGKTCLVEQAAWWLKTKYSLQTNFLQIHCNDLIRKAPTAEIAERFLERGIFHMSLHRPMIVAFDELDALAKARETNPSLGEFSLRVSSMFSEGFEPAIKKGGQLMVVGVTNDPTGIDEAVKDRLGPPVYAPMPNLEIIREIIEKRGIPESDKVADRLADHLGTSKISPRSLVYGCDDVKRCFLKGSSLDSDYVARLIIGSSSAIRSKKEVDDYELKNDTLIRTWQCVLVRWKY
jgi:SpoVK/Ycf46/Vps4 family AAA+-type ATPase